MWSIDMITSLKTDEGYIYAILEWEMTDEEHLLIKYAWVHTDYRNNGCIPKMIGQMTTHDLTQKTQFVGWERGDLNQPFKWKPLHKIFEMFGM